MRLLLLRHGTADPRDPDGDRPDRALVDRGVQQARLAGGLLRSLGRLDAALTSPYVRARQTAQVALSALAHPPRLDETEALLPDASVEAALTAIFAAASGEKAHVLAVGHEPLLSEIAADLIGDGGAAIDLRKGGLIELDVISRDPPRADLVGLLRPRYLR